VGNHTHVQTADERIWQGHRVPERRRHDGRLDSVIGMDRMQRCGVSTLLPSGSRLPGDTG
jgi:calcineurin-like phosphoesterase